LFEKTNMSKKNALLSSSKNHILFYSLGIYPSTLRLGDFGTNYIIFQKCSYFQKIIYSEFFFSRKNQEYLGIFRNILTFKMESSKIN